MKKSRIASSLLLACLVFAACQKETRQTDAASSIEDHNAIAKTKASGSNAVTVFATGLNNPRGLKFGPDGKLYVAEAGIGGTNSTEGQCPQAPPPMGPNTGSNNGGRVSVIDAAGNRTTVSDQLPSSQSAGPQPNISGPADVAFLGNQLYVLQDGAGCVNGVTNLPNGVLRIGAGGTPTLVADLSSWLLAHPPAKPSADFDRTGVWYSMIASGNKLIAMNANQGTLVQVTTDGNIKRIADMTTTVGHIVPTAMAEKGNVYFSNLDVFPITSQSAIYKINPSGKIKKLESGFSAVLGLVIDGGRKYVLEMSSGVLFPTPGTGRIVKVEPNGAREVVASGLNFPTAMTQGPDGNLYVSNWGFGLPPGGGQIVKVEINRKGSAK